MSMTLDNTSINSGQTVNITSWTFTVPAGSGSNPTLVDAVRNAACDAVVDSIDGGTGAGYVEIRQSTTVLVTINCSATAFGAAASGVATAAGTPLSGTAGASGTADNYRVYDGDDTLLWSSTAVS